MLYSTRSKLIAGFLGVSLLVAAVSLFIGVRILDQHVFGEARNRVRQDLNAVSEMYLTRVKHIKTSLSITTLGFAFISSLREKNAAELVLRLERMAKLADLDFAGIVLEDGSTLCRIGPNALSGRGRLGRKPHRPAGPGQPHPRFRHGDPGQRFPDRGEPLSRGTGAHPASPSAMIPPFAAARKRTSGMVIAAAVPVFEGNLLIGVLYGGMLLNRSETFVDTVRETVFQGESLQGAAASARPRSFSTMSASATNVLTAGRQACPGHPGRRPRCGTTCSARASCGRTAPLSSATGTSRPTARSRPSPASAAGMLYVGVLEEKYERHPAPVAHGLHPAHRGGHAGSPSGSGYLIASRISSPIQRLIQGQPAGERGQPDPRTRAAGKKRDRRAAEDLPGDGGGGGAPAGDLRGPHHPVAEAGERRDGWRPGSPTRSTTRSPAF